MQINFKHLGRNTSFQSKYKKCLIVFVNYYGMVLCKEMVLNACIWLRLKVKIRHAVWHFWSDISPTLFLLCDILKRVFRNIGINMLYTIKM